nr:MAG TPA: DNA-binding domain protein [Caudoviricetes sp.]
MIVRYLRTGEEPEPRTDAQEAVLIAIRPVMETSRSRIVAGGNGGKSSSNDAGKAESKRPSKTGSKPLSKSGSKTASKSSSNDAGKAESKWPSEEEEEVGRGIKEQERGSKARFRAPSPEEVAEYASAYASSKGVDLASTDFDPERFVDFYAQKGWVVGKTKMKDWKASVRNWVRSSKPKERKREVNDGCNDFSQYD